MGSERQRVHQKTNEKLDDIITAQQELRVARAADVGHVRVGRQGIARSIVHLAI